MNARPEMARARLIELPAGTELLREIRYMKTEEFAACSTDELLAASRWLRAASYSAAEGARRLDAVVRNRNTTEENRTDTCTSAPATTATSTSTEEPPTATPPPPARRSPSSRKRTAPE